MAKREKKVKAVEVLVVTQGFECDISSFRMNDFRKDTLPNFDEPGNVVYRKYYRIEVLKPNSRCPWGYSRWIKGKNGKLEMLDQDWDTSD